jgi:hypothetical protein
MARSEVEIIDWIWKELRSQIDVIEDWTQTSGGEDLDHRLYMLEHFEELLSERITLYQDIVREERERQAKD